jgi:acetyl-CoA C-acetyltransferase
MGCKPIARILGFADHERNPKEFTIAPAYVIPLALKRAGGLSISDVSLFEINEAFSVVALANMQILSLDHGKVNVAGGGVSLGHPIG